MNRRQFLLGAGAIGLGLTSYAANKYWPKPGLFNPCLTGLPEDLKNHPLMAQIWAGIDASQVWDSHVHLVGVGDSASGIWTNPAMESWMHPILKLQKKFYMNGTCTDPTKIDESMAARLAQLAGEMPSGFKTMLFAFDWAYDENGQRYQEHSIFHIPNDYAAKTASEHSHLFEWVASIHPYRADAIDALDAAKAKGARAIKWLPQAMNINPASPKCSAFYQKCAALNMPIISHTGRESAVPKGDQTLGNPLHMRAALEAGVRVVLAHCASDGDDEDLDNGNKRIKSFELFLRMMDTPAYEKVLFGEISAITLFNHAGAIKPILSRANNAWQGRLINGSDYPLPGINALISPAQLKAKGLLLPEHLDFLHDLRSYNPLMFDFAVKRLIAFEGQSFAPSVFETRKFFEA